MSTSQLLHDKRAVVFGAGGSIGAAVATGLAAEGAECLYRGGLAQRCAGRSPYHSRQRGAFV